MQKFVIDRSRHLTGEVLEAAKTQLHSSLLHSGTGLQCCLGQLGEHLGVPKPAMKDIGSPESLDPLRQEAFPQELFVTFLHDEGSTSFQDSSLSIEIQQINDEMGLSREERERKLAELFSKLDIEIEFVGNAQEAVDRALDYLSEKEDTKLVA